MRTDDLITMLAKGNVAVEDYTAQHRLAMALGWGLAGTILMMAFLGIRDDLAQAMTLPMFWVKLSMPIVATLAAVHLTRQVSVPGTLLARTPEILAALLLLTLGGAAIGLLSVPFEARSGLVFVGTWQTCALNIALLSLPLLAASLWAIKGLAPVRPKLAGASAGLLAGTGAAAVYALHCPEMNAVFLGVWYVLGIAIPTAAGAALGGRVLRW